jgi:hypothetical protein
MGSFVICTPRCAIGETKSRKWREEAFLGKPEGKESLRRPGTEWEGKIEIDK